MSSFEEENLYEIDVDGFLHSSESSPQPLLQPQSPFLNGHHTKFYILQEIVEDVGSDAEVGVVGSVRKKLFDDDGGKINVIELVKSLIKDGYNASLCHTYWPTALNCLGGEYEYIEILCDKGKKQCPWRIIVDIDFKSQFELSRPTSNYKKLCDILPSIFVGDEQKLRKIISIICGEAKNSFRERALYVPPWRTPCYMMSKWFSPSHHQKMASSITTSTAAARVDGDVFVSSKLMTQSTKYVGVHDQYCGLSSEFSSMSTTKSIESPFSSAN